MGKTGRPGWGVLPDPASSLLSVSKRLPRLESEPQIRRCARAWLPGGGWAHKGACWGKGARWQLSPPETKGYPGGVWGRRGQRGSPAGKADNPPFLRAESTSEAALGARRGAPVSVGAREPGHGSEKHRPS